MKNREQLNLNISNQAQALSLSSQAKNALAHFMANGLPHKKLENYKYTNVDSFFPEELKIKSPAPTFSEEKKDAAIWMEFVNGCLDPSTQNLPDGVSLEIKKNATKEASHFDSLESLNLVLNEETVIIKVSSNTSVEAPIHISHISNMDSSGSIVTTRLELDVEENSSVRFIEQFKSEEDALFNRNHMTTINVAQNANVEHVKVVTEGNSSFHFGSVNATVEKDANLHSFTFTTGAKVARNNINIDLAGVGARGEVHGLYALRGEQHCDNFSNIHHRVERTESEQLFKAVLDDSSHGIFTGKIVVHRDAQLVDSSQLNKNLLLSKKAHADTRPQLEVYADDVKCAHGATVGQLSEEELFYLESRAISPKDARVMLCHGFVQEALDKIRSIEIRSYLENLLYNEFEKDIHNRIREEA